MNIRVIVLFGVIIVSVFALTGCKAKTVEKSSVTQQEATADDEKGAVIITYGDGGFSPAEVKAKVGQKVVFKNRSSRNVQVNSAPHPTHTLYPELNLGSIDQGAGKFASFGKAGTYKYHNHLNQTESGSIVVE